MSFKIAVGVCLVLMVLMACISYYLGKKVFNSLTKYIPTFTFAIGVLFFYIKLNYIPYNSNSFDRIYDIIVIIMLSIVCSIAFLEAVIIDIVDSTKLFERSYMAVQKAIKLVNVNKVFKIKLPSGLVKKIRGLYLNKLPVIETNKKLFRNFRRR